MKIYFKSDNSTVHIPCTSGDDGCPPVYDGPTAVTPGAADVVLPTRGTSMIQDITVTGDPDLIPANIVQNVDIFGVQGEAVIPSLGALYATANGTYIAPQGTGYDEVNVAVPGSTGTKSITITANGTTTEDVASYAYAEITANVPNTYAASDEGKVVSSGALVAQTSRNITENGTYDTTLNDEVVVNVSGGGGGNYSEVISLINGTFTGALSNNDITAVPDGFCSGARNQGITSVSLPNCTAVGANGFYQRQYLSSINLPLCATLGNTAFGYSGGSANPYITILVFPSLTKCGMQAFRNMTYLTTFDTLGGTASSAWDTNVFVACSSLNTLILRQTSGISPIPNINFLASTPFASGGAGGTLYVPNALISAYQSATNWSTILGYTNNSIQAIEGSYYETHYADGTVIS